MAEQEYYQEVIGILKKEKMPKDRLARLKIKLCRKHKMPKVPTDIEIMMNAKKEDLALIKKNLVTKPTRSLSGVAPIAIMTKPLACPHGKCTYCPGGPGSAFGDVPQSYTGKEPSTMRAIRAGYDPYMIVFNRLEQYVVTGHVPDKVEIILQGGTFPAFPKKYQEDVVKHTFKAMNDFSRLFFDDEGLDMKKFKDFFELPGNVGNEKRTKSIQEKILKLNKKEKTTLEREHEKNEKAKIKCVGLTIETKPDWGFLEHGNEMLKLGCTRIELGVQSVYDEVLKVTHRGHDINDTIRSIKELKDLGFKLNFHYMPGLPKTTKEMDIKGIKELVYNDNYKPDMVKIYPCMVMKGTPLYHAWKSGNFTPITTKEAADIIVEFKKIVPKYCRIMRVQRDIPTYVTTAGVDRTNLRQYVEEIARKKNIVCRCIRCREVGRVDEKAKPELTVEEFYASGGKEFFIAFETEKALFGYCKMRYPSSFLRKEITKDSALIRELHVLGKAVSVGEKEEESAQHKGLGKKLLKEAEEIAKKDGRKKIVVISGVGVRGYYRKLGYKKEGPYMVKNI